MTIGPRPVVLFPAFYILCILISAVQVLGFRVDGQYTFFPHPVQCLDKRF
nr:MAG TPA: hypothetical protein [Caudoviricetes sp.]